MGLLNPSSLVAAWQGGRIARVYLFAGEETFLKEEALHRLESVLFPESGRIFNREVMPGATVTLAQLLEACDTLPFLTEPQGQGPPSKRLVIVRDAQRIPASHHAELATGLAALPETSCLILLWEGPWRREDLKRPLLQEVQRVGDVVECWPLSPRGAMAWMRDLVSHQGKRLTPDAAQALYDTSEGTLRELSQEVEKLCWFVGDRQEITVEDVHRQAGYREADPFRWAEALKLGDLPLSLTLLEQLLHEGEEPVRLLHLAARSLIQERPAGGQPPSLERWRTLTQAVQRADLAIKTGRETPATALTQLVIEALNATTSPPVGSPALPFSGPPPSSE